jgi:hypothetical protein
MFCPNCGEKLESPIQRFCSGCGSEIQSIFTPKAPKAPITPQPITEEPKFPTPTSAVSVYDSKPVKAGGKSPHSRLGFSFALVAIAFFIAGLIFGGTIILRILMPVYIYPYLPGGPGLWIIAFVLHILGFVFGIISRVSSSKAGKHDPDNALQKVGSVFGVFGIILNLIPLLLIPIMIAVANRPYYDPFMW